MASHRPPPIDRSTINGWRPQSPLPGYQGPPTVQTGKHGSWQFEDTNPAEIVSTPGTVVAPVRSAFQSYLIGIKIRADCAWCAGPGAVQVVQSVNW